MELQEGAALDIFQLRGLRKILHMKTTFIDRSNTNQEVYKRAQAQLKQGEKIETLSEQYLRRKMVHFCRRVVYEPDNPVRTVTFQGDGIEPRIHHPRRIGRPKKKWANTELEKIWEKIKIANAFGDNYDDRNPLHRDLVITRARQVLQNKGRVAPP